MVMVNLYRCHAINNLFYRNIGYIVQVQSLTSKGHNSNNSTPLPHYSTSSLKQFFFKVKFVHVYERVSCFKTLII